MDLRPALDIDAKLNFSKSPIGELLLLRLLCLFGSLTGSIEYFQVLRGLLYPISRLRKKFKY